MARSQSSLRYREGIDSNGLPAFALGQPSQRTPAEQRARAIAFGRTVGPSPTVLPAVTGTPTVGQTLTTTNGTWDGAPSFARQWFRGNTPIAGATALTYLLVAADAGYPIFCRVTATNGSGVTNADSNTTNRVAP